MSNTNQEEKPQARELLDDFMKMRGWTMDKPLGFSEAADFADWFASKFQTAELRWVKTSERLPKNKGEMFVRSLSGSRNKYVMWFNEKNNRFQMADGCLTVENSEWLEETLSLPSQPVSEVYGLRKLLSDTWETAMMKGFGVPGKQNKADYLNGICPNPDTIPTPQSTDNKYSVHFNSKEELDAWLQYEFNRKAGTGTKPSTTSLERDREIAEKAMDHILAILYNGPDEFIGMYKKKYLDENF